MTDFIELPILAVDVPYTPKDKCFACVVTEGKPYPYTVHFIEIHSVSLTGLADEILDVIVRYRPARVIIENIGPGRSIIDILMMRGVLGIDGTTTVYSKTNTPDCVA